MTDEQRIIASLSDSELSMWLDKYGELPVRTSWQWRRPADQKHRLEMQKREF